LALPQAGFQTNDFSFSPSWYGSVNLFWRKSSINKGFGGAIYLQPAEKALQWYLQNFPGATQLEDGALYWSSEVAKAILDIK